MNVLVIGGPIDPADIPTLCLRARMLLEATRGETVVCDVGSVGEPDVVVVDALARLQLTAKRFGCRISVLHAGDELEDLLELLGLREVLPCWDGSVVEVSGEPEHREPPGGVEEETDPGHLAP